MANTKGKCFVLLPGFAPDDLPVYGIRDILEERGNRVITAPFFGNKKISDFSELSQEDMLSGCFQAINNAKNDYQAVIGIGISLGGALLLEYAKTSSLTAIISVGTPFHLKHRGLIGLARIFYPIIYPFWHYAEKKNPSLRFLPIGAGKMVIKYLKSDFTNNLPKVKTPVLFLHSKRDAVADYHYVLRQMKEISSQNKKVILFNNGGHIINRDAKKIVNNALEFI